MVWYNQNVKKHADLTVPFLTLHSKHLVIICVEIFFKNHKLLMKALTCFSETRQLIYSLGRNYGWILFPTPNLDLGFIPGIGTSELL